MWSGTVDDMTTTTTRRSIRTALVTAAGLTAPTLSSCTSSTAAGGPADQGPESPATASESPYPITLPEQGAAPKSQAMHFKRRCDDGKSYRTTKKFEDSPALIDGPHDKSINVDEDHAGPKRLYTCSYTMVGEPSVRGTVYSVLVKR